MIKEAIEDYRYGISKIIIVSTEDKKWIKILDGDNDFLGPFILGKYIPLVLDFGTTVYATTGNALTLIGESDFDMYVMVQGKTGPPIPMPATNPSPSNGATEVSTSVVLSWDTVYESVNYRVYFGTSSGSLDMVSEQTAKTYAPVLSSNTTYYWRIDEYLDGNTAIGETWTFTTGE